MLCFANRVSSCLQHVLFCQPCTKMFCLSHCFISSISKRGIILIWNRNMPKSSLLQIVLLISARFELPPLVPWITYSISTLMNHLASGSNLLHVYKENIASLTEVAPCYETVCGYRFIICIILILKSE